MATLQLVVAFTLLGYFVVALVWSIAGLLESADRMKVDHKLRTISSIIWLISTAAAGKSLKSDGRWPSTRAYSRETASWKK